MEGSCLTSSCCANLSSLVCVNPSLTELDLSGNELGESGMIQLSAGLQHLGCKIQKLDLDGCRLTASCCEALAAIFRHNQSLTDLDLRVNNLGDSGMLHLCEGLKHPGCKIQKLKIKSCSFTDLCCVELSSVISTNSFLRELNIGGNDIGDSGLRLLCEGLKHPGCRIQALWVRHCALTSSCCADLASALSINLSLTELVLNNNELGDSGARQLCEELKHPGCKIQKLWMDSCSLTGSCCTDFASVLSANQYLGELSLGDNELGDSGVIQLCGGLKDPNCRLHTLGITECSLTGLCLGALASVFKTNTFLTELQLYQNDLEDSFVLQLFDGLQYSGCKMQILRIDSCTLTDSCCEQLACVLSTSQSLTELYLGNNVLGDDGVKQLCEGLKQPNCKIKLLWIGTCSLTGSSCVDLSSAVSINQSLTDLDLSCNELGDFGIRQLCEGLKHPDCKINKLGVGNCSLTAASCADLASVFSMNQSITELGLGMNEIGDAGVKLLCPGLKHPDCQIQKLEMNFCSLTSVCCADLASALSTNLSLTELRLNYNNLGDAGVTQLCEGLKHVNCKLHTLEMAKCSLSGLCCGDLATALCTNHSLTVLDLGDNELSDSGVRQLLEGLKHPGCKIQTLWMSDCFNTSSDCTEILSVPSTDQHPTDLSPSDDITRESRVKV